MARPSTPPILSELRSATSPASQIAALRALKNEIIGHEQRKEMWIGLGVLAPITRILGTRRGNGKKRHRDINGNGTQSKHKAVRNDDEEARLQAILIVGSLAHGGPAYLSPIYANHIISPLFSALSPTESPPYLVLAALKALNAVADALCLSYAEPHPVDHGLLSLLYTEEHLSTIISLLVQAPSALVAQQQIALTASLIAKTCSGEHYRAILAQNGILEALATCCTTFIASGKCSATSNHEDGGHQDLPTAHFELEISPILTAVANIIRNSDQRAEQFQSAPSLISMLQKQIGIGGSQNARALSDIPSNLVPYLPSPYPRSLLAMQFVFPPPGALRNYSKQPQNMRSFSSAVEPVQTQGLTYTGDDGESLLLQWLINIARTENEIAGLIAAELLATLSRFKLTGRLKEHWLARLLVPSLVRMLDRDLRFSSDASSVYELNLPLSTEQFVKQRAPAVLAMLAANSSDVQKAAADAGVISKLSQLLKETYDNMPESSSASMWTPGLSDSAQSRDRDQATTLGPEGISNAAHHILGVREAVLAALAAMASDKDEYRKAVIDNGVIPFVIKTLKTEESDTLSTHQPNLQSDARPKSRKSCTINNRFTILAACGTARAISRSVNTLRTSLMDVGLVAPLFNLLKSQDVELQTEATAVLTNLILHVSPLREPIIEGGAVKLLCEHAHSMNAKLRLNSIWALKHLVIDSPNELRMTCLEELGPGWLKQIISYHFEGTNSTPSRMDDGAATPIRMSTPNAAGEKVDLLNAVDEDFRESSQELEDDGEEDLKMADSIGALSKTEQLWKQSSSPSYQESLRGGLTRDFTTQGNVGASRTDQRSCTQALTDEAALQVQGLDFIRNLMTHSGKYAMIDYVFQELGQDKLFETLAAKLRPRVLNAFNRDRRSSGDAVRQVQPQSDIIISTLYLIIHIAAGLPRQRQVLISQTELLRLIVPLFSHPIKEVRLNCVWIAHNLTWVDDQSDNPNCRERAKALRNIGVCEKIDALEKDYDLDVRERAKTTRYQLSSLLR